MLAYLGRAGNAYLCCHYGVRTYLYVVCYLYKVVEFNTSTYDGSTHRSTVDSSIGTQLYIVFENNDAYLGYLFV